MGRTKDMAIDRLNEEEGYTYLPPIAARPKLDAVRDLVPVAPTPMPPLHVSERSEILRRMCASVSLEWTPELEASMLGDHKTVEVA